LILKGMNTRRSQMWKMSKSDVCVSRVSNRWHINHRLKSLTCIKSFILISTK
jgi:hypothetical protein